MLRFLSTAFLKEKEEGRAIIRGNQNRCRGYYLYPCMAFKEYQKKHQRWVNLFLDLDPPRLNTGERCALSEDEVLKLFAPRYSETPWKPLSVQLWFWTLPHLVDTKISGEYNTRGEEAGKTRQRTRGIYQGVQSRGGSPGTEAGEGGEPGRKGLGHQREAALPVDAPGRGRGRNRTATHPLTGAAPGRGTEPPGERAQSDGGGA